MIIIEGLAAGVRSKLRGQFNFGVQLHQVGDQDFTLTTPLLDRHRDRVCVHVVYRDGMTSIYEEDAGSELLQDTPEWVEVILNAGGCKRTFEGIGRDDVKDEDLAKALYELALCAAQISWGIHVEQHIKEDQ